MKTLLIATLMVALNPFAGNYTGAVNMEDNYQDTVQLTISESGDMVGTSHTGGSIMGLMNVDGSFSMSYRRTLWQGTTKRIPNGIEMNLTSVNGKKGIIRTRRLL